MQQTLQCAYKVPTHVSLNAPLLNDSPNFRKRMPSTISWRRQSPCSHNTLQRLLSSVSVRWDCLLLQKSTGAYKHFASTSSLQPKAVKHYTKALRLLSTTGDAVPCPPTRV
uniref:Uncharacterized protein n=1 Tax=Rhipicephalus zambeziensis TaxID=60191 RepID=A0A224YF65_9ACAR